MNTDGISDYAIMHSASNEDEGVKAIEHKYLVPILPRQVQRPTEHPTLTFMSKVAGCSYAPSQLCRYYNIIKNNDDRSC